MHYAIVDIETTGGSPKTSKITEIAIYKHDGDKVIDEFVTLVNPEMNIPEILRSNFMPPIQSSYEQRKPQRNKTSPPPPSPIKSNKHISFNTEVEEIEPSDCENDDELDAEIAEELKELDEAEDIEEEIEVETDLKNDE